LRAPGRECATLRSQTSKPPKYCNELTKKVGYRMTIKYDLLLKDGEVIDPGQDLRGHRDVAFRDGKVAAVAPDIPVAEARQTIDVSGKLVTPGLVDIHGHYFENLVPFAVSADSVCLPNGVTTSVDAGSAGWTHFDGLREFIIKREKTRLMALVNLSALGMLSQWREGGFGPTVGISGGPQALLPADFAGELMDLRFAQVEETVRCIQDNPNVALGVKVRLDANISGEANAIPALERARQVADITGTFVMVHVSNVPVPLDRVLELLRPGDIVTHIFHSANSNNILDEKGKVRSEVWEAKSKGIVMDIGADRTHYGVDVCRAAIEQGFLPTTISSDITQRRLSNLEPGLDRVIYTLPEVMTLFMGMGMSLEEVVNATTAEAARAIGQEVVLGTLREGAVGDAAVFQLEKGDFAYDDSRGVAVRTEERITPVLTVKDGLRWTPNAA
jgi:dihydroorotase